MRINCNLSAILANNQLNRSENKLSQSIERLSSGLRINHPEDDAAGLAISKTMNRQLKALEQAKRNTTDGVSVVQTAEGSLAEVQSMLQRMRELAVQAADSTYTDNDRAAIQKEINQLGEEIDRISRDTEYNTMPLLDGTLSRKSYYDTDGMITLSVSTSVPARDYEFTLNTAAKQPTGTLTLTGGPITATEAGLLKINGAEVEIAEGDTMTEVYSKIVECADRTGTQTDLTGTTVSLIGCEYGDSSKLTIEAGTDLAARLGMASEKVETTGTDCKVTLTGGYENSAVAVTSGDRITVTDNSGFEMTLKTTDAVAAGSSITFKVTNMGTLGIQAGALSGQRIEIDIPKMNTEILGIDKLYVGSTSFAGKAIDKLDKAIDMISDIRSKLGAYQNRLENTVENLAEYHENLTMSLSSIIDCDMAEEMTEYTTQNVITQAATSVMSQANQRPETVLQLLRQ